MNVVLKRVAVLLVCLCLLSVTVFAVNAPILDPSDAIIAPMNVYISSSYQNLSISAGIATCSASMAAASSITKVKIVSSLQYYQNGNWNTLTTFTTNANSDYASQYETYSVTSGRTYRLYTTYYAYIGTTLVENFSKSVSKSY